MQPDSERLRLWIEFLKAETRQIFRIFVPLIINPKNDEETNKTFTFYNQNKEASVLDKNKDRNKYNDKDTKETFLRP